MSYRESNIIVGCLSKHPNMDVSEFNKNYLNTLLDKLSKENKQVFLGDFSINVPNYNDSQSINELLDSLASNSFITYILQPAELTSHSETLIDNIFCNTIPPEVISSHITVTISDHLPQFLFASNVLS